MYFKWRSKKGCTRKICTATAKEMRVKMCNTNLAALRARPRPNFWVKPSRKLGRVFLDRLYYSRKIFDAPLKDEINPQPLNLLYIIRFRKDELGALSKKYRCEKKLGTQEFGGKKSF